MTTEQTHGHEILDLIAAHPDGIATEHLTTLATEKFGAGALYHTCSSEGMNLSSLLAFLRERDKIELRDGLILPGGSPVCDHDHH